MVFLFYRPFFRILYCRVSKPYTLAYLYRHIRLDKNEPFYIGIGEKESHSRAYEIVKRNKFWYRITAKTDFEVEIILDNLTWDQACQKEKEFIKLYGRRNLGTGMLCNLTNGGEGIVGLVRTKEHIEKLRQANIGKYVSEITKDKIRQYNIGRKATIATRLKMSKGKKGKQPSEAAMLGSKRYNENIRKPKVHKNAHGSPKMVICLTTGKVYKSVKEAAIEFGIGRTGLNKQLLGSRKNKFNLNYYN